MNGTDSFTKRKPQKENTKHNFKICQKQIFKPLNKIKLALYFSNGK
jgi:hypothetical protein